MGRLVLVALVFAGCASHAASGPAWPKSSYSDDDGGESIAPRVVRPVEAAAVDKTDDAKPAPPPAPTPAPAPAPVKDVVAPAVAPPAPAAVEPIMTEDIVIEIDD